MQEAADFLIRVLPQLLGGVSITLGVTAAALGLALTFGLLVALLRLGAARPIRLVMACYVEVMRIFPVLSLLFLLYFGLAGVGLRFDALQAAIVGLAIWGAAYLSETFRSGVEAIDRSQVEAGLAVGMRPAGVMRHVVLPQAIRIVLPAVVNFAVGLLKYSSVASTIGVLELMYQGRALAEITFRGMAVMLLVGAVYLGLSLPLAALAAWLQARLRRHVHVSVAP